MDSPPESLFVDQLRDAVTRYLRAVDAWESEYAKFFRLSRPGVENSKDMLGVQREYIQAREALEPMVPRARRLCMRYGSRDPFPGLLRVSLGTNSPQSLNGSAIGRNERNAISQTLVHLASAIAQGEPGPEMESGSPNLLDRIRNFFF